MSSTRIEKPDLPEYMTWEELERLPDEVAGQIELWAGRVVWLRRGPAEHQRFTRRLTNALESCARKSMAERPETCWQVDFENNVFLGDQGKSSSASFSISNAILGPWILNFPPATDPVVGSR
ncbi:hypothetical protein ABZV91_20065 [Nocardia sp. NPDC004568]|uniref:hypothetical protein n=1 Tax=Nocardia sp. NPDC004568 TaxID=3154551 RepID=UPI0033B530F3